jgi:hypothetical protein
MSNEPDPIPDAVPPDPIPPVIPDTEAWEIELHRQWEDRLAELMIRETRDKRKRQKEDAAKSSAESPEPELIPDGGVRTPFDENPNILRTTGFDSDYIPRVQHDPPQYVDLDQIAAIVHCSKRKLQRLLARKNNPMPGPDIDRGGGGKKNEWEWNEKLRLWLEAEFKYRLPSKYPSGLS